MPKIKAIIKRPDEQYGHMTYISASLSNLQRTVEGYIETVTLPAEKEELCIICNEEGKLMNLAPNMKIPNDLLVGTIIVCGTKGEEFSGIPIEFSEWKKLVDKWNGSASSSGKKIRVYDIVWNVDDEAAGFDVVKQNKLPSEVIIDNPTKEQLAANLNEWDDNIADHVSDMYGSFPLYSYRSEIIM